MNQSEPQYVVMVDGKKKSKPLSYYEAHSLMHRYRIGKYSGRDINVVPANAHH